MKMRSRTIGAVAAVLGLALFLPGTASAAQASKKVPAPLTAFELYQLYGNKTWDWGNGGGRFNETGRKFLGWSSDKGQTYFAEGSWSVDDLGQMCMRATWTDDSISKRNSTCFGHRKVGNVIYQRRQPSGKWYIFRHGAPKPGDEFLKLVPADTVSTKVEELKKTHMASK